jgi:hypothetical protein
MAVSTVNRPRVTPAQPGSSSSGKVHARRRLRSLLIINLVSFVAFGLVGELGCRLFWNARYWIRCENWVVGSGQTQAGRKWWPNTTYAMESSEFRVRFRTDGRGYRARPVPPVSGHPYRIAFVGDSFTEGMQVEYDRTFCALIERGLAGTVAGREVVCENYGVAATGLFEYWHRITHDVLRPTAPDALVLCIYPGNDFCEPYPDDAFEADGRPRREYFSQPGCYRHVLTWLSMKSKLANFIIIKSFIALIGMATPPPRDPWLWWADPSVAARSPDSPGIRRSRALLQAIAEECRRSRTKLCILVVGPVLYGPVVAYAAKDGRSPIGRLVADWQIDAPVIDLATAAVAAPNCERLVFPQDGHLNEAGHAFIAASAIPALRSALSLPKDPGSIALDDERGEPATTARK